MWIRVIKMKGNGFGFSGNDKDECNMMVVIEFPQCDEQFISGFQKIYC